MGVASNRVDIHQASAAGERALERLAEPLNALWRAPDQWPGALLDEAWLAMIRNSAHDSVCACSVDEVSDAVTQRYAEARQIAQGLTTRALAALGRAVGGDQTLAVNPSARAPKRPDRDGRARHRGRSPGPRCWPATRRTFPRGAHPVAVGRGAHRSALQRQRHRRRPAAARRRGGARAAGGPRSGSRLGHLERSGPHRGGRVGRRRSRRSRTGGVHPGGGDQGAGARARGAGLRMAPRRPRWRRPPASAPAPTRWHRSRWTAWC